MYVILKIHKGLSIKDVRSLGVCLSSADVFRKRGEGGSLDADVLPFWCKNFGFFEIYSMSVRIRAWVSADTMDRWVQYCAILCRYFLWTTPKI